MFPRRTREAIRSAVVAGDAAVTLVELTVAISIMGVLLAMITPLFVRLYATQNVTERMSTAQSQINAAFLRLDTEIRYASGISTPGQVGSDWYVEYVTNPAGTPTCTELRLTAAGELQRRSWRLASGPGASFPALVTGLNAGAPNVPFTLVNPGGSTIVQRLGVYLKVDGLPSFDVEFSALNSSPVDSNLATCVTDGRS